MFASHRGCVLCLVACAAFGCSTKSPPGSGVVPGGNAGSSGTDGNAGTSSGAAGNGSAGILIDVDGGSNPDGGNAVSDLTIMPADPVLQVTVVNGVVTSVTGGSDAKGTIAFKASSKGAVVAAKWSIDRGELGTLGVSDGSFLPNGNFSGVGVLSALYGKATATSKVTIKLSITQNGGTWDPTTATPGVGGIGGVGGEAPGGPLDDATRMRFGTPGTKPASSAEFGLLYPYNGTVWPRAMLAPLLQWQTTHTPTSAVFVHLSQANYDFQGFYAGTSVVREHIDQKAWAAATNGNGGDPLHVEVSIADATTVYGPVAQDWVIAPGQLKGTVYYNSYSTILANPVAGAKGEAAAILAIKPGRSDPELALPGAKDKCIVCHTVSDDGSTLFAQMSLIPNTDDYPNGASYDLTKGGTVIQNYTGSSTDGSTNNRKFLWSGLSKDGTYALQSNGPTQEAYGGKASVFRRDTGNAEVATGFDTQITKVATPAFSRDGKRVAFNYWTGTLAPGGGNGKTLDMMDFACGDVATPAAGAPSCSTYTFSSLVRLFTSTGTPGWPAWLPDSSGVVFQNNISGENPFATWNKAKTQIYFVGAPTAASMTPLPVAMNALNGDGDDGKSILPVATGVALHDDDDHMNYEPTVNPIVSGGYAWVVFTSRRMYGNIAQGMPYESSNSGKPITKKLWVAAVDLKWTPGKDPSHPAFYMPGQELAAGNMRGYWVVDACQKDGNTCETGDECCSGYCRPDDSGKLVCGGKPAGCAMEYEKCTSASDCCAVPGSDVDCINGFCAVSTPVK